MNGFVVDKITAEFGNQYLWVEGLISPENPDLSGHKNHAITLTTNYLQDYFLQEQDNLANIRSFLQQKKREQRHVVVWGASTKGILFNFLIDPECNLVDQCVDINIDKQGKFLPVTGKLIQSPEKILEKTANPVIIIMNPNYKSEIIALCQSYNLQAEFLRDGSNMNRHHVFGKEFPDYFARVGNLLFREAERRWKIDSAFT